MDDKAEERRPLRDGFADDDDEWDSKDGHETTTNRAPKYRPRSLASLFLIAACIFVMACLSAFLVVSGISTLPLPSDNSPRLRLRRDAQTMRIAVFSDLHFAEGSDQDRKTTDLMGAVLDQETPDLAVLNGDLITGESTTRDNSTKYLDILVRPMVHRSVPWAATYGNHDSAANLAREDIYAAERRYPLSHTRRMGPEGAGVTNYYILVEREGGKPGQPASPLAVLWFFDSRGGQAYQPDGQHRIDDWVAPQTAEWFKETSSRLRSRLGRQLPSIAFVHIPPHVFRDVANATGGVEAALFPGVNADKSPLGVQGQMSPESGDEPHVDHDAAFVDVLRSEEGLHSVHSGHDHGSAWCATWPAPAPGRGDARPINGRHGDDGDEDEQDGGHLNNTTQTKRPFLCFSKDTGYGGYGPWKRGARILELSFAAAGGSGGGGKVERRHGDEDDDGAMGKSHMLAAETWVRMDGGHIVTRVSLNETYGVDRYPSDDGE